MTGESDNEFSARELAEDKSEARRLIGNAKVALWDIDTDELTEREENRLSTVLGKLGDLEDIIEERELEEINGT